MTAHISVTDMGTSALQGVLGQHCLPWLEPQHLTSLRAASRAMRELVDGPHSAWVETTNGLLRPSMQPPGHSTGADWQAAVRKEWLFQRSLRAASLQHVTKMKAAPPGYGSFWVASPPPHSHCYLISKLETGSLLLLDPGDEQARPRQLALKPRASYHAFVLPDGRLRYVELASDEPLTTWAPMASQGLEGFEWDALRLYWHIFDPATGHVAKAETKCSWPVPSPRLHHIHHAGAGKVLGLLDFDKLLIMDQETLQQLAECHISPRHEDLTKRGTSTLHKVSWSPSGAMLAIVIRSNPQELRDGNGDWFKGVLAGSSMLAEIHVYDTATGQCLQSLPVTASEIKLWWSPREDQLAVYTYRECWDTFDTMGMPVPVLHSPPHTPSSEGNVEEAPAAAEVPTAEVPNPAAGGNGGDGSGSASSSSTGDDDSDDPANMAGEDYASGSSDQSDMYHAYIHLLRPASQKVDLVPCTPEGIPKAQWHRCEWSPHGYLLLGRWYTSCSGYDGEGFSVVDPSTLEVVFNTNGPAGHVSWAASFPSSLERPVVSAAFSGVRAFVDFTVKEDGGWQAMGFDRSDFSRNYDIEVSSDCSVLVGAWQKGRGRAHAFHMPLGGRYDDGYVLPKLPIKREGTWMQWSPLPALWPQVYAYVHLSKGGKRSKETDHHLDPAAVSLVDCRRLAVQASWTAADLSSQVKSRQLRGDETGEPHSVKWAPNGKHLAVLCEKCTLMMTFGAAN